MLKISVRVDIDRAMRRLTRLEREQVPFATAVALTRTGQAVKAALQNEINRSFDRPTPFTKNALFLTPATKARLRAKVWIKDRQVKYLYTGVWGGARNTKAFEHLLRKAGVLPDGWYAVASKYAPLDQYGNIRGALITKMLSQLQASRDPTANENFGVRRKRNRKARGRYFAIMPGRSHLPPGIYERLGSAWGSAVRPVFIYTPKRPGYRQRFRFYEVGEQVARDEFPYQFDVALRQALGSAR